MGAELWRNITQPVHGNHYGHRRGEGDRPRGGESASRFTFAGVVA